ncbi:MAG TPA: hypothetical protein VM939_00820 [Gemmatimonadaceae bacterium]|nr:hypothetical protein [Gemmatimonadaceae bacterium]
MTHLTDAVADKAHIAAADRVELRDAVCAYVVVEHARGIALIAIIDTVKNILADAERESRQTSDELAQQLIDWCLQYHLGAVRGGLADPRIVT